MTLWQAVTSWVQAFAFDASANEGVDGNGIDGDRDGFLSEGDGESPEDMMTGLQMECTVHEVLLKSQASERASEAVTLCRLC